MMNQIPLDVMLHGIGALIVLMYVWWMYWGEN